MFSFLKFRSAMLSAALALPAACLLALASPSANADVSESVLHSFAGSPSDGAYSYAPLVQAQDGSLYGTTYQGGANDVGSIYKIAPNGQESLLYSFAGGTDDGEYPAGGLTIGSDGTLYGVTAYGGLSDEGIVFSIKPNGSSYTVLHMFSGGADGAYPYGGALTFGNDGQLYGTTYGDAPGGSPVEQGGYGTIFSISTDGSGYTVQYLFGDANSAIDGEYPQCTLLAAPGPSATLYGFTTEGGSGGDGTVFALTPGQTTGSGTLQVLHSFNDGTVANDSEEPYAGSLQMDASGSLYGEGYYGGTDDEGTVFKLSPDSSSATGYTETILHSFGDGSVANDGDTATGGLLLASDGNLYGVTYEGGTEDGGIAFVIATDGSGYAPIYNFYSNTSDGYYTYSGLIEDGNGNLLGTNYDGGSQGYGTVYSLATALAVASFTSVSASPQSVVGGQANATGTVALDHPAPLGGVTITLQSANSSVASVPASVTIPAGSTSANFTITTYAVTSNYNVYIAGTYKNATLFTSLMVTPQPMAPAQSLRLVSASPTSTQGGTITTANRVYLANIAKTDAVVSLTSSNPAVASVPATVTVQAGYSSRTFSIKTQTVITPQTVTITASYNGATKSTTLTVNPSPTALRTVTLSPASAQGGATTTANRVSLVGNANQNVTVTLTSSNPAVASVPSTVTVQAGYSSHVFTVKTSAVTTTQKVTITATSNGVSKTATLTVTP